MKLWLSRLTIVCYLSALFYGIACHSLYFKTGAHAVMYYIVWDMFCGWSSYESRMHVIGEGESGKFYELAPGPWGEIKPFGDIDRRHYDPYGDSCAVLALNTLRHTQHEPMTRMFVVEECWPKKFNMPDSVWQKRYDEPKDVKKYYQVRRILAPDGSVVRSYLNWTAIQASIAVSQNPRLQANMQRNKPFYALDPQNSSYRTVAVDAFEDGARGVGSPLGH
jgi:hypothetical protein